MLNRVVENDNEALENELKMKIPGKADYVRYARQL